MSDPMEARNRYYEWTNDLFGNLPFDLKYANLISLGCALVLGNPGAVKYFHKAASNSGASTAEIAAAVDVANAATGLNIYALLRDIENPAQ
jgi:alkylhydroperoxidase/carboxymuconolactone decarboxylase family protein YurZ